MLSGVRVIQCDVCKQAVSGLVGADIVIYGLVICPSCCDRVPQSLMNKFLESAAWPNAVEIKKENSNG